LKRTTKLALAGLLVVALFAGIGAWLISRRVEIDLRPGLNPVPPNGSTLNGTDIEKIFGEEFRVIHRVNRVPPVVMKSFVNFAQLPFDLENPGEEISSDVLIPGKSSRRLVFLAVSSNSAVLLYEQGGFANSFNAVVFWFGAEGRGWGATLERGPLPHDVLSLKQAIQNGNFHPWKSPGKLARRLRAMLDGLTATVPVGLIHMDG